MDKQEGRFCTREEAIDSLYRVINSGIIEDELADELQEVANLVEFEMKGEHFWGRPYKECDKLITFHREDLMTNDLIEEARQQHLNARFIPASNEIEELKEFFEEMRGIDEDSTDEDIEQFKTDFFDYYGVSYDS